MLFLAGFMLSAQTRPGDLELKLVKAGFANVRAWQEDSLLVVALENDAHKLQASGVAEAVRIIGQDAASVGRKRKVVVTEYGLPQVTLTYEPHTGRWRTTYRLDESWQKVKSLEKRASSFGKFDVVFYPQLAIKNLIITQVYQTLWDVCPELQVSLWPGMRVSAMVKFPIFNDGYGRLESKVHPGPLTLSQRFRLPGNVFGKFTVGTFNAGRFGTSLDVKYPLPNERFSLLANASYVGTLFWSGFHAYYYSEMYMCWMFGGSYYWPKYRTQFILKAQQFIYGDRGVKFEMMRHFRYATVGFYLEKGPDAHSNGGFRFQIALPPYKVKRRGAWPRVRTSGNVGMVYNSNNEQYYYKEFKSESSDNIMQDNAFNPYYINSEILELNN